MTKFRFQGTGETYDGSMPVMLALGLLAAAAVIAWLLTVLWVLAAIGLVILGLIGGGVVFLRRTASGDQGARQIAQQAARLRDEIEARDRPQITAQQPQMIVNHFHGGSHLHITPGSDTAGIIRQALTESPLIQED